MGAIDEIKQRVDIVEVASQYVPGLKKVGRNFKALCPFHPDKVPSFYIFPERQSWHCFGACGTGGDVFSLVMKKEGVEFSEALHILAERAGVSLVTPQGGERKGETDRLKKMNEAAADYYHYLLLHASSGERPRSYLAHRGVSSKTIEDFRLGFSLDSWEALREHLTSKGYHEDELVAAGLLVQKESGGTYDRFRNRLMFPIRDISGGALGFGARALDNSLPKYLNSPQTNIFDKSNLLYGIDRAKSAIRRQNLAVVVEGYMDVIIAHQYGFDNVVASLGTALTENQVSIVKKITKNLTLALDADVAGEMATLRGQNVIAQAFSQPVSISGWTQSYENIYNAEWKVAILLAGKDPDEIIRESTEKWQQLIEQAVPVMDYTFDTIVSKLDLTKLGDKSTAVDQLLPVVCEIKDPVYQAHYLQKLARLVAVDEKNLALALKRMKRSSRIKHDVTSPSTLVPQLSLSDPLAEYCLLLLLHYPKLRHQAAELSADYFTNTEHQLLFLAWYKAPDLDSMRQGLDTVLGQHLDVISSKPLPPMSEVEQEQAFDDCLHRLQERQLRDLKAKEEWLLSDVQSEDGADLEELQQLAVKLNTQMREVFLHGMGKKVSKKARG